ncbi:MAG: radical SAM protein [Terrimicrobiaceae bacterium]
MINLTHLYLGGSPQDDNSCDHDGARIPPGGNAERKPEVIWNLTRRCNLRCAHCYSDSEPRGYAGELNFRECKTVVDDLARFGVRNVSLSGGEPLTHPDFFAIARYASERGLPLTLSTNGMLLRRAAAYSLRAIGFSYVGITLDGIGEAHDTFRGHHGAFEGAVTALRNCQRVGQKVGFHLTLTSHTMDHLSEILDFIEVENIPSVCFEHFVFCGRGAGVQLVDPFWVRAAMDLILERMKSWHRRGIKTEVFTKGQPADAAYLFLRLREENPRRAEEALELLKENPVPRPGDTIAAIDSGGRVQPDQFWQTQCLGNVREKPFSQIWTESQDDLLLGLRHLGSSLRGRCAECDHLEVCGGGLRVRAAQFHNDPWGPDPECYLTSEEVLSHN